MIKVQLIVVQGKPEGKTIPLAGPVFRIGRDPSCHLRPSSDQVSRNHAEIAITSDSVILKDLGSRNGTILNGRTITAPAKLKSGDLIKIGHLTFAVSIQGAAVPAQEPATPRPVSTAAPSLDEVPQETVEAWLIADNERPVPDRPSGVYDGDTITIDAYKEAKSGAKPPSSREMPTAPESRPPAPETPAPPPVAQEPKPPTEKVAASSESPSYLQNVEFDELPEGEGDAGPEASQAAEDADEEEDDADADASELTEDELMDESNPFYVARKQAASGAGNEAEKQQAYKDSSDAARDILNRMLERRRNR